MVSIDGVPGLRVSLLANQPPQSVFDVNIVQLIGFLQQYQSTVANSERLTHVLGLLQQYQSSCPNLQSMQLIYPWYGASPSIDIKIDSKVGLSAELQLSCILADGLIQYIRAS